jgi:hypothetical protein
MESYPWVLAIQTEYLVTQDSMAVAFLPPQKSMVNAAQPPLLGRCSISIGEGWELLHDN